MIKSLDCEVDRKSAKAIRAFFSAMRLPIPAPGEFYSATSGRKLVFLTDYGLVLRFTPKRSVMHAENPHFIKSLFNMKAGNYEIDIDPGYECPVTQNEADRIYDMLEKNYGITVSDGKPHNLCRVPGTRFPIVIDLDPNLTRLDPGFAHIDMAAAGKLSKGISYVKMLLGLKEKNAGGNLQEKILAPDNPQVEIYAPLREAIGKAWSSRWCAPDPEGIKNFLRLAKEFRQSGKLVAPWTTNNYWNTTATSIKYGERLMAANLP